MVNYCCMLKCNNNSKANPSLHFFVIPKDPARQLVWLQLIGRTDLISEQPEIVAKKRVCSEHFSKKMFAGLSFTRLKKDALPDVLKEGNETTGLTTKRRRLKKGAIPSQNIPVDPIILPKNAPSRKHKTDRSERKNYITDTSVDEKLTEAIPSTSQDEEENVETWESEECNIDQDLAQELVESSLREIPIDEDVELQENGIEQADIDFQEENFTILALIDTNEHLNAFTGIPNFKMLNEIAKGVKLAESSSESMKLSVMHCVMLVFIKLKLNLSFVCISAFFRIAEKSCENYFHSTINSLRILLEHAINFPDKEEIMRTLPTYFIGKYADTRIVLHGTEIPIEEFNSLNCGKNCYSPFKGNQTVKVLIGFTPSGMISYVSKTYIGKTSEKAIFMESRILEKCISEEDAIIVDKASQIQEECDQHKIKLIRLPFFKEQIELTTPQKAYTPEIVSIKEHAERCIQRLEMFKILEGPICQNILPDIDDIMIVIAGIVNLAKPILADDDD